MGKTIDREAICDLEFICWVMLSWLDWLEACWRPPLVAGRGGVVLAEGGDS